MAPETRQRRSCRKQFHCEICGRNFSRKWNLSQHIEAHSSKDRLSHRKKEETENELECESPLKAFSCELCDKQFISKEALDYHKLIHDRSLPFSCKLCQKSFASKVDKVKHLAVHSSDNKRSRSLVNDKQRRSRNEKKVGPPNSENKEVHGSENSESSNSESFESFDNTKGSEEITASIISRQPFVSLDNILSRRTRSRKAILLHVGDELKVKVRNSVDPQETDSDFDPPDNQKNLSSSSSYNSCYIEFITSLHKKKGPHTRKSAPNTFSSCENAAPVFSNQDVPAISDNEGPKDSATDDNNESGLESDNESTKADDSEDEIIIVYDSQRDAERSQKQTPQDLESNDVPNEATSEESYICPIDGCGTVMNGEEVSGRMGVNHMVKIHSLIPAKMLKYGLLWRKL
eukprot:TRINITY_DN41634_c0_g1_i7.p1 TRINITY_DN41634_c0_g1~~TRINITY_DN41634_c0_g1_i7.p1  ORF type:complete len:404 (+),score=68.46 TRINITY_DN41634_c0_g1_i7:167-1378(+)